MKILCFGDSNTFGYDPRSILNSRYGKEDRWVDLVQAQTGWELINAGQNGREIPRRSFEITSVQQLILQHQPDLILVMLGTNDLLQGADPERITERMENFLRQLPVDVFLLAPPPLKRGTWITEDALLTDAAVHSDKFRELAQRLDIPFADPFHWGIDLLFDGVHFSETGHHTFARQLIAALKTIV